MPPEVQLLVIVLAVAGFWLIVVRPARNAQRRTLALQSSLEVGDEVILSSGIFGAVRSLADAKVGIEVADGVVVTVARQAVVRKVDDLPAEPADRPTDDQE